MDRGHGVEAYAAADAGFLFLLGDDVRTSTDGWDWTVVNESALSDAFPQSVVVLGDQVVGVGMPAGGEVLKGWFGSAVIRR